MAMIQGGSGDWREEREGWKWCECIFISIFKSNEKNLKKEEASLYMKSQKQWLLTHDQHKIKQSKFQHWWKQSSGHFVEYLLVVVGSWGQRLLFYFRGRPVIGYLCSGACIGNIIQATEMQKKNLERTWSLERDVFRHLGVLGDINVWDFHTAFYIHLKF